jgi:lipoate-protein ligase A
MEWRYFDTGPCSAPFNMALDEAIATSVSKRGSPPTLRLYGWDSPSLSLGRFQKLTDINFIYCMHNNIPVVRRPTGGRAILHHKELTYSFSSRTDRGPFSRGLLSSYRDIGRALSLALNRSGIAVYTKDRKESGRNLAGSPLCFQTSSYGEILIENRKVIGSAQKRWQNSMLQQGSIPYVLDDASMKNIFSLSEKAGTLSDHMVGLMEVSPVLDEKELKKSILESFEEVFGIRFVHSRPSADESLLARQLEIRKYLPVTGPHESQKRDLP